MKDEMAIIVICRHCGKPEFYGEMRCLNSKSECRSCYKHHREEIDGKPYAWTDLDGPRPTMEKFLQQEDEICLACVECGSKIDCNGCEHQHEHADA